MRFKRVETTKKKMLECIQGTYYGGDVILTNPRQGKIICLWDNGLISKSKDIVLFRALLNDINFIYSYSYPKYYEGRRVRLIIEVNKKLKRIKSIAIEYEGNNGVIKNYNSLNNINYLLNRNFLPYLQIIIIKIIKGYMKDVFDIKK